MVLPSFLLPRYPHSVPRCCCSSSYSITVRLYNLVFKKYFYIHKEFLFPSQHDNLQLCSFVFKWHELLVTWSQVWMFPFAAPCSYSESSGIWSLSNPDFPSGYSFFFSSAYSFLELPQVHTSKCVAKTAEMDLLTALESWLLQSLQVSLLGLQGGHLLLLPVIFLNFFKCGIVSAYKYIVSPGPGLTHMSFQGSIYKCRTFWNTRWTQWVSALVSEAFVISMWEVFFAHIYTHVSTHTPHLKRRIFYLLPRRHMYPHEAWNCFTMDRGWVAMGCCKFYSTQHQVLFMDIFS